MMMSLAAKANAPPPEPQPAPVVEAPPAPKPQVVTLTEDETEKMAALSTKISAMSAASEDTVQSMGAQVLQEAHEHVATCMSRLISTDTKSTDSMMQLNQSMQAGLNRM